ncbi:Glycosyltransferase, catalytic subunit of cellulose synthase and poly-beta-1,6-N-acetylglucosamine synthase [Pseudonocardia thermophila]|uniref:Glycosyltransferase, catalytic subunit of cellulose synthase and poly-beta-1,6-N-acetylglucosamine synthase n=1 Tax=Pseudonocardia thermophila TaxID=1848 RepID=A0A1M6UZ40_PSETH|nr:glycosyltransferase family 2 protein [Pseudonocardia thermophila]SHK74468.1 Glycosyltransferase, catalytic subunit of cellulose synthase and poly-beta-1,6-N-acetylglucosamine synthase [Pseudonocardia thermophila]
MTTTGSTAATTPTPRYPASPQPTVRLQVPPRLQPPSPVRPGVTSFVVTFLVAISVSGWTFSQQGATTGTLSWVTTILWTLPCSASLIGIAGAIRTLRRLRGLRREPPPPPVHDAKLLVVVPTIGRFATYPALERVVRSYRRALPTHFPRMRVDVVVEEGCEALGRIALLAGPQVRIVIVPRAYRTPAGTRFKARANHYAHELRIREGEARDDVWVLHMDDDTGVDVDTSAAIARFVHAQRGRGAAAKHLAQGVLTYPREHGAQRLLWLADAVRPACDLSTFALTTGTGTPRAGVHGELLLVRASVEAEIGWDFGPRAIVEDAQFALHFADRYPGRSDWFAGRSLGATPASVTDLVRQRERWAWGLMELSVNRSVPLRHRLLLIHNMIIWGCGPLQHVAVVLVAGALLGDLDTLPVTAALLPVWAMNIAYQVWTYWEGLKLNARASADGRRRWWERIAVVALMPLFSLWEAAGVLCGVVRFVRHGETTFTVIAKPL